MNIQKDIVLVQNACWNSNLFPTIEILQGVSSINYYKYVWEKQMQCLAGCYELGASLR